VPPPRKGSLYLRPLLFGSGASLGVSAASEYTFVVFGSPVQNYFKEGTAALNLYVEEVVPRAYIGGTGAVKAISNYGPVLDAMRRAKARGFSDVLYLDAETKKNIEEVSAANIFLVKGNTIVTPATNGTILRGIIRESVIEIALDLGYKVEERVVPVQELKEAEEVFCTGTAAGIASVGSITFQNIRTEYKVGDGLVTQQLRSILVGIQTGTIQDTKHWILVLKALSRAKSRGFSDVLYLDSVKKKYLEEASSCNVFVIKGRTISTPATNGTILEGITRKSVMEIASDQGYEVVEKALHVDEVMDADEVFCTGTAVGVAPVGTITYQDKRVEYETGDESVCQKLRSVLVGIQTGSIEDTKGWVTCIN
ncbi:hypothetical protein F2Q69_00060598, partial [Brassica cretica]